MAGNKFRIFSASARTFAHKWWWLSERHHKADRLYMFMIHLELQAFLTASLNSMRVGGMCSSGIGFLRPCQTGSIGLTSSEAAG